jgi:SAM-dependent methyltransferase
MVKNTEQNIDISGYRFFGGELCDNHSYLLPTLFRILNSLELKEKDRNIFELGCGNGSVANELNHSGYGIIGVDPSSEGIAQANLNYPELKLYHGSAYDDLATQFGQFPIVISLEVIEHVYFPREFAASLFSLVQKGGTAIISTPYHGYWKNLALAISGKMDQHFTALWDNGHIKFWSFNTLSILLNEAGFDEILFTRAGRIPILAKSMFAVARKR